MESTLTTRPTRTVPGQRLLDGMIGRAGHVVIAEFGSQLARIGMTFAVLDSSSTV